ncbi:MAG: MATE family efflux transporter, partial [Bacteroidota bacterium]
MKNTTVDLINGPIDSSLRKFSIPLAFSFIVHMLYSLVDTFYVSRLGPEAIAAVGISEQIIFFIFTIGSGFAIGTGIVVSRRVGEGRRRDAGFAASQAIVSMFVIASALAAAFYYLTDDLLALMNISGKENIMAQHYLSALIFAIPFYFISFQCSSIIRSTGNSVLTMQIMIITTVINAVLSPLMIFGIGPFSEMGIFGAGLATAIAQLSGTIMYIAALSMKFTPVEIIFKHFKFDFKIVINIIRIGFPATLNLLSVSINRILLFSLANVFGTDVMAAYTLGLKVDLFVFMPIFAVSSAIEITTGQNLGAGKPERVFLYFRSAVKQLGSIMILMGVIVFFGGEYFVKLFTTMPEVIEETVIYLKITAFSYVLFTIGNVSTRVINGA